MSFPLAASAQLPNVQMWRVADTSATVSLSIASSGGVSIGAYQAGATWMLVELLNAMRQDEQFRARHRLPHYTLANLSGASAGSINALLAALRWCAPDRRESAESSAFWDVWNQIGIMQLSPEQRGPDVRELGLFERSTLTRTLERRIVDDVAALQGPCAVSLAVTASRLIPGQLPLNSLLTANVQRYLAVYTVRRDAPSASPRIRDLIFPAPTVVQRDTALGKQLVLATANSDSAVDVHTFLQLLTASSSVPYLFAPVPLTYCDAVPASIAGGCGPGHALEPERARFVDGGTIDNAPVYTALRLLAIEDSLATAAYEIQPAASGVILVGHKARRNVPPTDSLGSAGSAAAAATRPQCKAPENPEHCGGLGSLVQFLGGLIAGGSQYELQWLIRLRAQDSVLRRLDIDLTTRHPSIVGERLHNAAAFFGRPFRESDFHSGMYDALHYASSGLLCLPEHQSDTTSSNTECIVRGVQELISLIPLSCASILTLQQELQAEYPAAVLDSMTCGSRNTSDMDRAEAYRAVKRALEATQRPDLIACAQRGTVAGMLCQAGLTGMFDLLRQDTAFARYARSQYDACRAASKHTSDPIAQERIRGDCFVDDDFVFTLAHPGRGFFRRFRFLLDRMQWLEEEVEDQEGGANALVHWDAGTQFLNYFGRSALLAEDKGWIAFPTVVPRRNSAWRVATGALLPQQAEVQLLGKAWALQWSPLSYRASSGVVVGSDFGWVKNAYATPLAPPGKLTSPWRFTSQVVAGYRPRAKGRALLSGTSVGLRYWRPSAVDRQQGASMLTTNDLSPLVRADVLWDRFSLTATTTPGYAASRDRRKLRVSVVVNDVGGALYWMVRSRSLR